MTSWISFIHHKLLKATAFFGIKLWVAITLCIGIAIVLASSITLYCFLIFRHRRSQKQGFSTKKIITSKSVQTPKSLSTSSRMMTKRLLSRNGWDIEMCADNGTQEKQVTYYYDQSATMVENKPSSVASEIRAVGKEYTLNEMETATNGFDDANVVGCGDYGVVYRGVLLDHTRVAVKKLLVNRARLKDLATEVESLWCLRHKNLVKLLGFCTEGMFSLLVYEYLDNGNLYQWLHESRCKSLSPLTWKIRMEIIRGIAKGLAYLHEDSETAIPHQHLKSSNVLLDKQWNPKISDFGISKLLGPDKSGVPAPPPGMSGYTAAPEYEDGKAFIKEVKSDVYSFGALVTEIVSGRTSVKQQAATETEEYLVEWMKSMVSEGKLEEVLDPKLPEMPSTMELKRIVLIALRCVDPDASNRPKMGDVIHMLEPRDLLLSDEIVIKRVTSRRSSLKEDLHSPESRD